MASKVVIEDFRGSGTLAGTSPGTLTGVSSAVWATYNQSLTPNSNYTRTSSATTVVVPSSGQSNFARLDLVGVTHASGTTVIEASVLPGMQFRVSFDLEDNELALEVDAAGNGNWRFTLFGSNVNGSFSGSALGALVTLRMEVTSTAARYYVNNTLKYTHGSGFGYGIDIDWVRFGIPRVYAAHGMTVASTPDALDGLHLVTETVSGSLTTPEGLVSDVGPLGAVAVLAHAGVLGRAADPGPLGGARLMADHDFTDVLEAAGVVELYFCDLVDGEATTRVPVSSWQGTQQIDGASYLQVVVPAVADLVATINGLSDEAEFVVSRCARFPDGTMVVQEMARSLVEQVQLDQGPQRYTCTISGYSAEFEAPTGDLPPVRVLRGVRMISSGTSGTRTRCAIDWYLRPGCPALAGAMPLTPDYINYYAEGADAYMDAGARV